jgi:hypothetical protein
VWSIDRRQLRLLLVPGIAVGVVASVLLLLWAAGADTRLLIRDPLVAAQAERNWLGAISQVMVLVWAVAAGVLAATSLLSRKAGLPPKRAAMFLAAAVLVLGLGLDDALVFHDALAPEDLGISQRAVKAAWVVLGLAWAVAYRRQLMEGHPQLLLAAGALFAASLAFDRVELLTYEVDDGAKFSGILTLLGWSLLECRRTIDDALQLRQPDSASSVASKSVRETPPTAGDVTPASR